MLNRIIPLTKPLQTGLRTVTRAAVTTSGLFSKKNNNLSNNTAKNNSNTTQRRQYLADATTVIPDEIEKFGKMAERWWDPTGEMKLLHQMNPKRVGFIRNHLCKLFNLDPYSPKPLQGLKILDVGCGAGLLAESLARLGATVTGIDAAEPNIAAARAHHERAGEHGDHVTYEHVTAESLKARVGASYDVVCCLEVIEHVKSVDVLLDSLQGLVKPGGALVLSTIDRTLKSWFLTIGAAEYLLRWVSVGTHHWSQYIRPQELVSKVSNRGLEVREVKGMKYNPLKEAWSETNDTTVNYFLFAVKPEGK
jgi:2-polyprenyl-6-hydroxyphenyl methylase/3-demethylubiquinone-9 3-methyltransferase